MRLGQTKYDKPNHGSNGMTDTELWQEILAENPGAWRKLVERYQSLVYAVCIRSGLPVADAADCFQQTWVLLYKSRKRIKDPSRLSAWLVTTAKREVLRVKRLRERSAASDSSAQLIVPAVLPDEELEQLERQAQIELGMKQLDGRCRRVLDALFFAPESETYEKLANSLGIAPNSLGPIRHRCLNKLKKILLENGFEEERKID